MVQAQCRHCREEVPSQARFCPQCGEPWAAEPGVRANAKTTEIGPTFAWPGQASRKDSAHQAAPYRMPSERGRGQDNATVAIPRGEFTKRNRTLLLTIPLCLLAAVAVVGLVMPRQPDASVGRDVIRGNERASSPAAMAMDSLARPPSAPAEHAPPKVGPPPAWALAEAAILERSARSSRSTKSSGKAALKTEKNSSRKQGRGAGATPSRRRASSARVDVMTGSGAKTHAESVRTALPLSTTPSPWRDDGAKGAVAEGEPMASLDMGKVLYEKGEDRRAEAAFLAARRETPADPDAIMGLGMVALRRGRYQEAQIHFREAIRIAPRRAAYHVWLGHALLGGDIPALAAVAYQEALVIEPGSASAKEGLRIALTKSAGH